MVFYLDIDLLFRTSHDVTSQDCVALLPSSMNFIIFLAKITQEILFSKTAHLLCSVVLAIPGFFLIIISLLLSGILESEC